jgi:hypothetical protein
VSNTALTEELISAYKTTHFHVLDDVPFVLKVGEISPSLANLYRTHQVNSAAFITAHNPFSQVFSLENNIDRNLKLQSDIKALNLILIDGYGQDPLKQWDKEDSFLILGLEIDQAKTLGVKYEQNAIVWCTHEAIPELILLR